MADFEGCEIFASVTVEGLEVMGSSPVPAIYICSSTSVFLPPAAPLVCPAAGLAYTAGQFAQSPMGKKLMETAAEFGCDVAVRATATATEVLLLKGAQKETKFENLMQEAEQVYSSLNTIEGVNRLANALASGQR
jgi:hypothetical protein